MRIKQIIACIIVFIVFATTVIIPSSINAEQSDVVYESFDKACDVIRYNVLQWKNEIGSSAFDFYFIVKYRTQNFNEDTIYEELRKEIFKHTGDYYKGDSLLANINEFGLSVKAEKDDNDYIVTVLVYGEYILTRSKIRKLNKWIEDNALWLATKKYKTGSTEYGKAYGIFLWITKNCHYGRNEVDNIINSHVTAYGAKYNQAICHGIAHLYYMMAAKCGLQCRMMVSGDHAWNVVKIDGKWYIVDPTFALGKSESAAKKYFLIGSSNYSRYSKRNKNMYGGNITVSKANYKKK